MDKTHPEKLCELCGGPNVCWFTASELWNKYARSQGLGIICPICFIKTVEEKGFVPTSWEIKPESQEKC